MNDAVRPLLATTVGAYHVFEELTRRRWDQGGEAEVDRLLALAPGAERVIHGHSPHGRLQPVSLFGGKALNIDGALWAHGRLKRDQPPGGQQRFRRGFILDVASGRRLIHPRAT